MDKLVALMRYQRNLLERLEPEWFNWSTPQRTAFIKDLVVHLNVEIAEMLQELPYVKPWKDYSKLSEERVGIMMSRARQEAVDALHFFLELLVVLGFTSDELFKMYEDKNAINHQRQEEGYIHE